MHHIRTYLARKHRLSDDFEHRGETFVPDVIVKHKWDHRDTSFRIRPVFSPKTSLQMRGCVRYGSALVLATSLSSGHLEC